MILHDLAMWPGLYVHVSILGHGHPEQSQLAGLKAMIKDDQFASNDQFACFAKPTCFELKHSGALPKASMVWDRSLPRLYFTLRMSWNLGLAVALAQSISISPTSF